MRGKILIFLLISLIESTSAEESHLQDYRLAQEALARNDCHAALPYLQSYKIKNKANLDKNPEFAGQLEKQISECANRLKPEKPTKKYLAATPRDGNGAATASTPSKDAAKHDFSSKQTYDASRNIQGRF